MKAHNMVRYLFSLCSILVMVNSIYGQSYQQWISKADSLYQVKDYTSSIAAYQQAFQVSSPKALEVYNASCAAALSGRDSLAFEWLEWSISLGWKNADHLRRDPDLKSLRHSSQWEILLQKAEENQIRDDASYPKPQLKRALEQLYHRDQVLRQLLASAQEKFGEGTAEMKAYWNLMQREDSLCWHALEQLLEVHGWPGKSEVGGQANTAAWLIVQHAPLEKQIYYVQLMEASVKEGESQGAQLAMLYDRIQMRQGKPQRYGSQIHRNAEGKMEVYSLEDPNLVNNWRQEVGLGPLEEYAQRFGVEWKAP